MFNIKISCGNEGAKHDLSNTAVHSDMVMWNVNEKVESAALQIASVLYGVPQVSVKLCEISDEHKQMIKHYLGFWRKNRDVLINEKLTVREPLAYYSQACATLGVFCMIYKRHFALFLLQNKGWLL